MPNNNQSLQILSDMIPDFQVDTCDPLVRMILKNLVSAGEKFVAYLSSSDPE